MGVATSCEKALDYYRRVAQSVASEVSFSGGAALQRVRLQDEIENGGYSSGVLDNDLIEYYQFVFASLLTHMNTDFEFLILLITCVKSHAFW